VLTFWHCPPLSASADLLALPTAAQAASDMVGEVLQRTYKGGATTSESVGHVNSALQALAQRMTAVAASSQAHWGCPPPEAAMLPQVRLPAFVKCLATLDAQLNEHEGLHRGPACHS
jgi:hypothetical protein